MPWFLPRKQLRWVEPAVLCLLRVAVSVSVFLEVLQDKGGRQELGKETEKKLSSLEKHALCFP